MREIDITAYSFDRHTYDYISQNDSIFYKCFYAFKIKKKFCGNCIIIFILLNTYLKDKKLHCNNYFLNIIINYFSNAMF